MLSSKVSLYGIDNYAFDKALFNVHCELRDFEMLLELYPISGVDYHLKKIWKEINYIYKLCEDEFNDFKKEED